MRKKAKGLNFTYVAVAFLVIASLMPLLWGILISFKTNGEIVNSPLSWPADFSFENYRRALDVLDLGAMYKNTLILVVFSTFLSVVLTFMSSFAITRMHYKKRKFRRIFIYTYSLGLLFRSIFYFFRSIVLIRHLEFSVHDSV